MTATVWVSGWQMECCGDPFSVGDEVEWPLREPDRPWLESTLGTTTAAEVTYMEDHHGTDDATPARRRGIVRRIQAVSLVSAPITRRSRVHLAVPGSHQTVDVVNSLDPLTPSDGGRDRHSFTGYLVDLDLFEEER